MKIYGIWFVIEYKAVKNLVIQVFNRNKNVFQLYQITFTITYKKPIYNKAIYKCKVTLILLYKQTVSTRIKHKLLI